VHGVEQLAIRSARGGAILPVKVVPGSSRDRIVGPLGDALKIATSAPAEKGKANAAVADLLAKVLGVAPKDVCLASSPSRARKDFHIAGLSVDQLRRRLTEI
jgi:hypothetical protein